MKINVHHRCDDFHSYRAERVKSLFNVDTGANFQIEAELDLDSAPWQIGVIVGPSGSGKTSLGRALWGAQAIYQPTWPADAPIIDVIAADQTVGGFDAATNYVASVQGQPVAHLAVSTRPGLTEARACRLVVMPEWQGAGVGIRFLDAICERWRQGQNRYDRPMLTLFHTSHPGLASALRRSPRWTQVSARLVGESKVRSLASMRLSAERHGKAKTGAGYGGHFRAVQGFRYLGEKPCV